MQRVRFRAPPLFPRKPKGEKRDPIESLFEQVVLCLCMCVRVCMHVVAPVWRVRMRVAGRHVLRGSCGAKRLHFQRLGVM